jgi:hypothetical protein
MIIHPHHRNVSFYRETRVLSESLTPSRAKAVSALPHQLAQVLVV